MYCVVSTLALHKAASKKALVETSRHVCFSVLVVASRCGLKGLSLLFGTCLEDFKGRSLL